jgi:hypothetical protein
MDYPLFLVSRRRLMGQVVRDAYTKLREHGYAPRLSRYRASFRGPTAQYTLVDALWGFTWLI